MKPKLDPANRESGQATIELILLLIISIIIILSLLYQFNQGFKAYTQAFFEGYIACLLETGELPGTPNSLCKAEYKAYDPNAGRMLVKDTMPEGKGGANWEGKGGANWEGKGGANWEGRGGANWGGSSSKGTGGAGSSGSGSGSGSGNDGTGGSNPTESVAGNSYMGQGSRAGAYGVGRVNSRFGRGSGTTPVGDVNDAKNVSGLGGSDSLLGRSPSTSVGNLERGVSRRNAIAMGWGYYGDEEARAKETARPPVSAVAKKSQGSEGLRPTKTKVDLNRKVASAKSDNSGGWSMSEIVKFLFIVALVLAIVIFFGGQIMQVSKSWEK